MNVRKGMIAGLGVASLLVAMPAQAGGGKSADTSSGSAGSSAGATGSGSGSGGMHSGGMHSGMSERAAGQNQITGKVEKFDESNKELTLSLKVSENTQVLKDGRAASLSDIKEGDQVRASFTGSGETLQVTRIEVMSEGAARPAPSGSGMGTGGSATPPGSGGGSGATGGSGSPGSGRGY